MEIGQRITIWEILPTIRYSLNIGSWIAEREPQQGKITYINTPLGMIAACANEKISDIKIEVKKVGVIVIKSIKDKN